ncbi:MAG: cache domain-containing protein [Pseudomonadota bacterium]
MKFQKNALAALLGSLLVVIVLITWLNNRLFVSTTEQTETSQYGLMKSIIDFNLQGAENSAMARAEMLASLPRIRELFAAGDRDGLAAEVKQMFAIQKDKYGADQAQFHLPPATSFLRLNDPAKFGDDLSSFRPIVVAVNKDYVPRKGLSISRAGPGIFGVVPVNNLEGKPVGTFERGADFGVVLDRIKTAYGLESALFMDEAKLKQSATSLGGEIFSEKNRVGRYIKFHSTNWELMRKLVSDAELSSPSIEKEPYQRDAQDTPYGVVVIALRNPAGEALGMIAVAKDFSPSRSAMGQSMIWLVMYSLVGLVLLAGAIILVVRGALVRPLAALNQRFGALAEGGSAEPLPNPEDFYSELGTLAQHYEKLRLQQAQAKEAESSAP